MPRQSTRTVALPLFVTLLILVGLTAVLTHPDERIALSITGTTVAPAPPSSAGPRTYTVTGTADSRALVYRRFNHINVTLVRKDGRTGSAQRIKMATPGGVLLGATSSSTSDLKGGSFSAAITITAILDKTDLFIRLTPEEQARRPHDPVDVPIGPD